MNDYREIERKFLVIAPPDRIADDDGVEIEQGYLAITDEIEVRLRRAGTATRLTIKAGRGDVREEVEIDIDAHAFDALWPRTDGRRLRKVRRKVPLEDSLTAEVDFFEGGLRGLVVAEVEFDSVSAEHDFTPPSWFGEEVTRNRRYDGQSLAVDGPPQKERVGSPYRLKRKESVSDGTRRIACGRLEKALGRLEEDEADHETAVHQARKDLKKLRAVLRLVRDGLGERFYRAQNKRFRDAGRLLSDVRDAQVKIATLDALDERFGPEMPEQPYSLWRGMLEGERRQAGEEAGGHPRARIREARTMIAGGAEELGDWPVGGHGWSLVETGLVRAYREARKAMKRARASQAAEDVHEWRKRTKDLWYHLRLLRGSWKPLMGELADQAHELADLLGDHHDLTVLCEDLEGRRAIREREQICELIDRRQDELLGESLELGSRLFAEKPKDFRRRTKRYWRAWR